MCLEKCILGTELWTKGRMARSQSEKRDYGSSLTERRDWVRLNSVYEALGEIQGKGGGATLSNGSLVLLARSNKQVSCLFGDPQFMGGQETLGKGTKEERK